MNWSEEELIALEVGVVGGFARGCRAGGITRFSPSSLNSKGRTRMESFISKMAR
jgi:hypothetical protein